MDEGSPCRMGLGSTVLSPSDSFLVHTTLSFYRALLPIRNLWIRFVDDENLSDRLYSKGRVLGHKRAKRNTRPNTSLLQIEGVGSKEEAQFYLGKVRRYSLLVYKS